MSIRCHIALVMLLTFAQVAPAHTSYSRADDQRHIEVSMRMIGHQLLLSSGDSSSIILPIEKQDNQYKIRFGSEFEFDPESVGLVIDSVIQATQISENYIVEFVTCNTQQVVHSYEIGERTDVLACQGRAQPLSCYELWISLLDAPSPSEEESASTIALAEDESGTDRSLLLFWLVAGSATLAALVLVLWRRKSKQAINPNEVTLGEFIFKKKSMELLYKDERIELTGKEADLLQLLSASANDTVVREDILKAVWGDDGDYVGRTLDVFISKLRKKLESDSNVRIVNIRGIGYKLVLTN